MTNRFAAEMDALDRKAGRVHTVDDWRRVGEKAPGELTDDDIVIIGYFDGETAASAALAKRAAVVRMEEWQPAYWRMCTAPLQLTDRDFLVLKTFGGDTQEATARDLQRAARPPTTAPATTAPETWDELIARHGDQRVTFKVFGACVNALMDAFKHRADTLEKANKDLQTRVLELEAARAAAQPVREDVTP